jgi:hypothetical protein
VIPRESVAELVRAHAALDEPTTGAIWIHHGRPEAWLVEVIPAMGSDARADEPVFFNPGVEFRFPLALIAGNRQSLEEALKRNVELAQAVAEGEVIVDQGDAEALVELARQIANAA